MKRKLLIIVFVVITCIACAFGFTACGNGEEDNPTHAVHKWSSTYTDVGDRHYQTCSGCYDWKYSDHDYGADGVCVCGKRKPETPPATVDVIGVTMPWISLSLEVGDE